MGYDVAVLLAPTFKRAAVAFMVAAIAAGCGLLLGIDELTDPQPGAGGATSSTTSTPTTGNTGGGGDTGDGGGGGTVEGVNNYAYRQQINIDASKKALLAGHTVELVIDHKSMVETGNSRDSGDDVRILRKVGTGWHEVDRVLDANSSWEHATTTIHFELEDGLTGIGEDYFLYYGNESPDTVKADPDIVYLSWDDFDDDNVAQLEISQFGSAEATATVADGVLKLEGRGNKIAGSSDDFVFMSRQLTQDVVFDVQIVKFDGPIGQQAILGGVMIRKALTTDAPHATIGLKQDMKADFVRRADTGGNTEKTLSMTNVPQPTLLRLTRHGTSFTASLLTASKKWESLPSQVIASLNGSVFVGIPFTTDNQTLFASVEIDWYRMRRAADPEPALSLQPVETSPYPDA